MSRFMEISYRCVITLDLPYNTSIKIYALQSFNIVPLNKKYFNYEIMTNRNWRKNLIVYYLCCMCLKEKK